MSLQHPHGEGAPCHYFIDDPWGAARARAQHVTMSCEDAGGRLETGRDEHVRARVWAYLNDTEGILNKRGTPTAKGRCVSVGTCVLANARYKNKMKRRGPRAAGCQMFAAAAALRPVL